MYKITESMSDRGYRFRNHTADVELVAHGKSMEEAFSNAALALFDTSADIDALARAGGRTLHLKVKDSASTPTDLLWVMLQDILSLADSKGVYCYKVGSMSILQSEGRYLLRADFLGRRESPKYSAIYVKGVSRFDLRVTKKGGKVLARAVLDV